MTGALIPTFILYPCLLLSFTREGGQCGLRIDDWGVPVEGLSLRGAAGDEAISVPAKIASLRSQ